MSIFQSLVDSPVGQLIGGSNHLVGAAFQYVHILGLIALLTAALLVSLRVLGWGLRKQPLQDIAQSARPLLYWGLAATVGSGLLMFASNAVIYASNPALQLKVVLLLLAVAVQVAFFRWIAVKPERSAGLHVGAIASLVLWFGTGLAGRAIGFV
jgi:hypothetical protein